MTRTVARAAPNAKRPEGCAVEHVPRRAPRGLRRAPKRRAERPEGCAVEHAPRQAPQGLRRAPKRRAERPEDCAAPRDAHGFLLVISRSGGL
ncbi:hypothetical protein [Polyangium mundeleinium]|uniref:Uncharacterized protein n=1 Tax=Polyangium mundeleinium TaxID=2995306 RepID=A0ABT5EN48_9BACT|nr:hypothetical protein [Polyangium mundeleinium]MDC0743258.1 hypothetical protein [Polyangium mundeleinium]